MTDISDTSTHQAPGAPDDDATRRVWAFRLIGPALGVLTWLALGSAEGISPEARIVAGIH